MTRGRENPVAFVASRIRVEEKRLLDEFDRRRIGYELLDPRTAVFLLDEREAGYRGAINREIAHHRSLYTARILEHRGVRVVNSAADIALCGDKLLTTLALRQAGVPVPRCMVALTPQAAAAGLREFGLPAVVKPVTGSWGRLAALLNDHEAAEAVLEHREALPSPQQRITYVQEYVDKPGRDIRGLVAGDEVIGAVYRVAEEWRTNTSRSARTVVCEVSAELESLLLAAAKAVGTGFYAVDVLEDRAGALYVNEINHTPEFHGAAEVLGTDIAARYVDHVVRLLGER